MVSKRSLLKPGEHKLPACPVGLEHINRYWDKRHNAFAAKILPGEYYVSLHDEIINTVLGSCISACIYDKYAGIGGMNHFMLPLGSTTEYSGKEHLTSATRYGNFAMEILINEIIKAGGQKRNMEVKLFGGAKVITSMLTTDIGLKNISFVYDYLEIEKLRVIADDVGDVYPRKVLFYPATGRVMIKKLQKVHNDTIRVREERYRSKINKDPVESDIELF